MARSDCIDRVYLMILDRSLAQPLYCVEMENTSHIDSTDNSFQNGLHTDSDDVGRCTKFRGF